jgi:hypothetical protein
MIRFLLSPEPRRMCERDQLTTGADLGAVDKVRPGGWIDPSHLTIAPSRVQIAECRVQTRVHESESAHCSSSPRVPSGRDRSWNSHVIGTCPDVTSAATATVPFKDDMCTLYLNYINHRNSSRRPDLRDFILGSLVR